MRVNCRRGLAAAAALLFGLSATAQAKALVMVGPQTPAAQAANADAIVIGKVTEVETDAVDVTPYKGAPKDQKVSFKVAVLKVDEALLGGSGLTRFRVGFPADAPAAVAPPASEAPPVPVRPGGLARVRRPGMAAPVALTAGMEGCFFLTRHPVADFYVLTAGPPLQKKDEKYAKELEQVKKVVKAIDDPVGALKAKDLGDRFQAAHVVLQRYQTPRGSTAREPILAEENKLIVALLAELPWQPKDAVPARAGEMAPSRSALWYQINPNELGFKQPQPQPQRPGDPPVDFNRVMDEATSKFLKENADKIKIKRFVAR